MTEVLDIEGAHVVDNLVGVPSYHYDPIFAHIASRVITAFRPSVVALELPSGVEEELEWAASCWPSAVVAASPTTFFPFVPGDSILETYRIARRHQIPVVLLDLSVVPQRARHREKPRPATTLLGPEFACRSEGLFLEVTDMLLARSGPPERSDLAREAHMAAALAALMAARGRVMWVGGMAHWTRIIGRIREQDFAGPAVCVCRQSGFRRMSLAPSALYRMTRRLPWLVERYGIDPERYEEATATQLMALEAARRSERGDGLLVLLPGQEESTFSDAEADEGIAPADVARVLLYARNLALTAGVRERPEFGELLTAASATIGPMYAGRLYEIAMAERTFPQSRDHEPLEWEIKGGRERYRCGDDVLGAKPWWPSQGGLVLSIKQVRRRARDEIYKDLPKKTKGGRAYWECYPADEEAYVSFVNYLLRRASLSDPGEARSLSFSSGLRDGLDVRATLRNWSKGTVYVREEQRGHLNFTNAAIDWTSASEHSDILTGTKPGGWIDPDLTQLGSCSRTTEPMRMLQEDPWTQLNHREFSLVTLDLPTSARDRDNAETKTFYDRVILPLLGLQNTADDDLYGWLDVMFAFCTGKPLAHYSRYVPSPEVHRIAWRHNVQLVHFPFRRLPARLVDRNGTFRFMSLTRKQWEEFKRRRAEAAGPWSAPRRRRRPCPEGRMDYPAPDRTNQTPNVTRPGENDILDIGMGRRGAERRAAISRRVLVPGSGDDAHLLHVRYRP